jgi:hypothetical protein
MLKVFHFGNMLLMCFYAAATAALLKQVFCGKSSKNEKKRNGKRREKKTKNENFGKLMVGIFSGTFGRRWKIIIMLNI